MADWHVYRDGGLWLVDAHGILDAAEKAHASWLDGPTGGARPTKRLRDSPKPDLADKDSGLYKAAALCQVRAGPGDRELAIVYESAEGGRSLVVTPVPEPVPLRLAVHAALAADAALAEARALRPRQIAVDSYKTGKRRGQPRFTKKHGPDIRAQVEAAQQHNADIEASKGDREACLHVTLEVLVTVEVPRPKTFAEHDATKLLLDQLTEIVPWERGDVKAWGVAGYKTLAKAREALESIRDHGFAPGTRCTVAPDPRALPDDLSPYGVCEITGASVDHYTYGDRHTRTLTDQAGRDWGDVALCWLRELDR